MPPKLRVFIDFLMDPQRQPGDNPARAITLRAGA
jgi:hypothetical protein